MKDSNPANHTHSMKDFNLLTYDQLVKENERLRDNLNKLEINNLSLRVTITNLHNQIEENNKCTSRCQPPTQTYKELETKLQNFEIDKNREIDELWATQIKPLREKVEKCEKSLDLAQSMTVNDGKHIRELQETIKDQQVIINYAAGYISACEQFRDKHPNDVVKWLFKGLK